ncbi:hypothetical protein C0J52_06533 [Blattella germanica]|nr:hypothetical protein C0J52_06533 [Blattella germanica]
MLEYYETMDILENPCYYHIQVAYKRKKIIHLSVLSAQLVPATMVMLGFSSAIFVIILFSGVNAEKATFHNYRVFRLVPNNQDQLTALRQLENISNGLRFWKEPTRVQNFVDIMVPPHMLLNFEDFITTHNLEAELFIRDVQYLIDNERPLTHQRAGFGWTDYYTLEEIYDWLDSLVAANPGVVSPIVGGETYEGRQIRGVKVSYKEGNPGVIIEGGIHAREWISPATVTYILNKLLTSNDPVIQELAQSFDFYVFPSVNPDGYAYTHSTDRMWRKTRSPSSNGCYGADPNRNWDFHWMEIGASSQPCSETYAGSSPFSEIEAKSLSQYISSLVDKFDVYLAFHSYSQLLMFPYGQSNEHVSNYDELMTLAAEAAAALAQNNGTRYQYGNIYDTIYPTSGVSMDWVRGIYDKPYTFTWELRDTGRYGFLLPASQIIDTAEETLNSVVVILQHAKSKLKTHGN